MLNGNQIRKVLFPLLDDTRKKEIPWTSTKFGFETILRNYHFYFFTRGKLRRTEMFAIEKDHKPIYIVWLRPGNENYDVLALISHELQKPEAP